MLWKCCTQYASKFGKLSSGHRTGNGQFSFQSQRKAMPKNAQTITQLPSSYMLAKKYSKFSKSGFNRTWTVNFQMFKLGLEKAEESEIKLPTSVASSKKWEFQKSICFWFIDYTKAFDCVDHNKLWKILQEMGLPDHLMCLLRNLYAGREASVRTGHGTTNWIQIGNAYVKAVYCHPAYLTYMQSISYEMPDWWSTSWNQDCQEKYQ